MNLQTIEDRLDWLENCIPTQSQECRLDAPGSAVLCVIVAAVALFAVAWILG